MNDLPPMVRRLAALALLLLALLLLVSYLLLPLRDYFAQKAQDVDWAQQRLARYQGLLSNAEQIDSEQQRVAVEIETEELFLQGDKPAIVAANLQEFVDGVIRRSGGQPGSSQEYQARALPGSRAIGLRVSATAGVRELVSILYVLENSRPMVFVEGLDIATAARRSGPQRDNRATAARPGDTRLKITMDVVGYLSGEEG